jgi:hypothetical protein
MIRVSLRIGFVFNKKHADIGFDFYTRPWPRYGFVLLPCLAHFACLPRLCDFETYDVAVAVLTFAAIVFGVFEE